MPSDHQCNFMPHKHSKSNLNVAYIFFINNFFLLAPQILRVRLICGVDLPYLLENKTPLF
ncbi:hypothetical protein C0J52_06710 [Blattella germanica]|nr:hypothetical protein C0J52_06710 [Blattella germanica]